MSALPRAEGSFVEELRAHDDAVRAVLPELWIGAEPTFTRADSQHVAWLFEARGDDKEERARTLLRALAPRLAARVRLFAVEGRRYAGEDESRFALAATWSRDGAMRAVVEEDALERPPVPVPTIDHATTALLTVTPDPGVVEVNAAPCASLEDFHAHATAIYAAARDAGLSTVRHRYNGDAGDSGGGGQLSLGGPSPARSPFFTQPLLLPSFLRYFNAHPSLSYAFAPPCIGSAGQGPRPDEGVRERFEELDLTLAVLEARADAGEEITPEQLWCALAPLLVDGSGNAHRAEINVEKLWSPHLGARGKLGVVELRSLAMPDTPERMTVLAALFRAIAARLVRAPFREPLRDWGGALHDRFALPSLLADDLRAVLDDLDRHDVGLGPSMRAELLQPPDAIARVHLDDAELVISPAREFWPLLGDTASQEHAGARLVDASTQRIELQVHAPASTWPGHVTVQNVPIPLVRSGARHLAGVRYRAFVPSPGLHASLPVHDPLEVVWIRGARAITLLLHAWKPGGGGYDGLPASRDEAERRRKERVIVRARSIQPRTEPMPALPSANDVRFTVDLRRPRPL